MNNSWKRAGGWVLGASIAVGTILGSAALGNAAAADKKPKAKEAAKPAAASASASAKQPDYEAILKPLKFREIGPAVMGGRIDDFAVVESNPDIIYAGTASGGVFKTTNGGTTWEPLFDNEAVSTIGAIALAPSDPSNVWVGTGEANNRQSSSWGNGVYRSTDAGKTWKNVGLAETQHIGRIVVHPSDPNTVYVAAAGRLWGASKERGVYKTTDGGRTWNNVLFINEDTGVTDIAMDNESPGTLIAAAYQRRRTVFGYSGSGPSGGLYKTTDGGATWKKLEKGLPWDPNAKPAAGQGSRGGRGSEAASSEAAPGATGTGTAGGTGAAAGTASPTTATRPGTAAAAGGAATGTRAGVSPAPDEGTGRNAAAAANQNPSEVAAAAAIEPPAGQAQAAQPQAAGAPAVAEGPQAPPSAEAMKEIGRMGVSFYRRDSNIVYALVEHAAGGIYRSEDKGESWTKMSSTNPRASYYSQVRIDPNNDQRIWVHGAEMFYSEDGGKTFRQNVVQKIHGDFHAMWIDPRDSSHMLAGSDGGIHISRDRGRTWDFVNTIPLGQFYEIGLDMAKPYHICGGLQDNNAWCGPSASMDNRGISNSDWITVGGGDGFYAQVDPTDPNIVYAESQDGNVLRRNLATHEARSIRPPAPEGERYRFQWNSPIVISAFDPKSIYYGGNFLFKSTNRGDEWARMGPDLTNGQDRDKLPIMGRVPDKNTLSRHDGVQQWPSITTISESPANKDVVWVGTDDGNLQVTRDGGKTWKNVAERVKGVPKGTYVSRVLASRMGDGAAYVTFDGHRSNDFNIYVYATSDFGESWRAIRNGIPDNKGTLHVIREHPRNPRLLFAGTEYGAYVSFDQGERWSRLKLNLPTVPVDDIAIHPRDNDLVLGTHGRSIWILDDISPLQQMGDAILAEDMHVFTPRTATEWRIANRGGSSGHKAFLGPNPPNGALINYYFKNKPDDKERVRITITDKDGKLVKELDGTKEAGVNRVVWDLRTRSATAVPPPPGGPIEPPETEPGQGGGGFGGRTAGTIRVEPGEYTVKVTAGKNEQSTKVRVEEDPRIMMSAEDSGARRQALTQLYPMAESAAKTQRNLTGLHTALNAFIEGWKKPEAFKPPDAIQKTARDLLKKVDDTCKKFAAPAQCGERAEGLGTAGPPLVYVPPPVGQRVTQLMGAIDNFGAAPTAWQLDQIKLLQGLLNDALASATKITQEELPALNKMMNDAGVPHIIIPPPTRQPPPGDGDPLAEDGP